MTSTDLNNKPHTLTTLPLSILSRILRYLCPHDPFDRTNRISAPFLLPFRHPRVTHSLQCTRTLCVQLPTELLPPALSSPVLAIAVASILGDRVSHLTHWNTGGQLPAWIEAFAPYVKAISPADPYPTCFMESLRSAVPPGSISELEIQQATQRKRSLHLFKTLSIHGVMLEVLDLQDVPFLNLCIWDDDIMAGLCATLESNSGTLRQLALPVFGASDICDKALQMSHLKKLDVLTVKVWYGHAGDWKLLPPPTVRVIRAVDGHADKSRKLATLRELRFLYVDSLGYPYLTASDRDSPVFLSIKTLRVAMYPDTSYSSDNVRFISLFKNLERLFWNANPRSSDLCFEKLYTRVREVHVCTFRGILESIEVGAREHYGVGCGLFSEGSYDRRYDSGVITSVYAGPVSWRDMRNMMMHCPRLEDLSVHIRRDKIRAIRKLVRKCQEMKCLELVFDEQKDGRLEAEDWHAVSRVIPKSHKSLCHLVIEDVGGNSRAMTRLEGVFGCFERVTKALGNRAKKLAFRSRFRTSDGAKIMERVCELLNVCIQHTPALESLCIKPRMTKRDTSDYNRGWAKGVARRLIDTESRLLQEVKSLRCLHIGASPWLLQRLDRNDDSLETDSIGCETEWTSSSLQTTESKLFRDVKMCLTQCDRAQDLSANNDHDVQM